VKPQTPEEWNGALNTSVGATNGRGLSRLPDDEALRCRPPEAT